jgi:mannobiose 2-epimerase
MFELINEIEQELKSILNYWKKYVTDNENGGFYGQVDLHNNPVPEASKGGILNARILWTFSAAYQHTKDESDLKTATRAYDYLRTTFIDTTHGGIFWELDAKGNKLNGRKQIYAQAFTIYALAEYYKITDNEQALEWSIEIFMLLEKYSFDPKRGGYIEAFAEDWSALDDVRLSPKDSNEKKTMNTHLHILEAYSNLYSIWENDALKKALKTLIGSFTKHIVLPNNHLGLFYNEDWQLKGESISYGHDIEAAWLLFESAEILDDDDILSEVSDVSIKIASSTLKEGFGKYGSIINHKHANGDLDENIEWWIPAEAMVGFLNAWQLSDDMNYLIAFKSNWQFIKKYVIDKKKGEWHWTIDKNGKRQGDEKVGFWKCPYHNTRACLEILKRIS